MIVNDNYLKESLKHVYWLNGGPCSGKTTMTKKLVKELGFRTLSDDILKYRKFSDVNVHKAIQMPNPELDWDKWFNRSPEIYKDWLLDVSREMLDYFIIDLLKMSDDKPVVVDLGISPELILPFMDKERILCLYTSRTEIERLYLYRDDHSMILDRIMKSTKNPDKSIINANKAMVLYSNSVVSSCVEFGIDTLERTSDLTIEDQFNIVCEKFKL